MNLNALYILCRFVNRLLCLIPLSGFGPRVCCLCILESYVDRTSLFDQAKPAGAPAASSSSSARPRSKNDEVVMAWMKTRIVNLERELKDVRAALDAERARAAPSSEREDYLIGELDLINQMFECGYTRPDLRLCCLKVI